MIAKERISFLLMKWRRLGENVRGGILFSDKVCCNCLLFSDLLQLAGLESIPHIEL